MQCQLCGKRPARRALHGDREQQEVGVSRLREVRGGARATTRLWSKPSSPSGDLLSGMVDQAGAGEEAKVGRACSARAATWSTPRSRRPGRLGCSECYTTFPRPAAAPASADPRQHEARRQDTGARFRPRRAAARGAASPRGHAGGDRARGVRDRGRAPGPNPGRSRRKAA